MVNAREDYWYLEGKEKEVVWEIVTFNFWALDGKIWDSRKWNGMIKIIQPRWEWNFPFWFLYPFCYVILQSLFPRNVFVHNAQREEEPGKGMNEAVCSAGDLLALSWALMLDAHMPMVSAVFLPDSPSWPCLREGAQHKVNSTNFVSNVVSKWKLRLNSGLFWFRYLGHIQSDQEGGRRWPS